MKKCVKCGELKYNAEFYHRSATGYCRLCYQKNRDMLVPIPSETQKKNRNTYARERYHNDPEYREKRLSNASKYQKTHRESINAAKRKYNHEHRWKENEKKRKRDLIKAGIPGTHSIEEWEKLKIACGNKCVKCGNDNKKLARDHIIPITLPGCTDYIFNLQPMFGRCNSAKQNRECVDYRPENVKIDFGISG